MTRFAGEKLAAAAGDGDYSAPQGRSRAVGQHDRYAFRGYNADSRRVAPPELEDSTYANELREQTTAKRKAKEEEDRLKALYA